MQFAISEATACAWSDADSGCNNFGKRTDLETSRQGDPQGDRLGITMSIRRHLSGRADRNVLGQVLGDRRKDHRGWRTKIPSR